MTKADCCFRFLASSISYGTQKRDAKPLMSLSLTLLDAFTANTTEVRTEEDKSRSFVAVQVCLQQAV